MVPHEPGTRRSRRCFLRTSALVGTALGTLGSDRVAAADVPSAPGASVSPYGTRSRFEQARRLPGSSRTPQATVSYTPLADLYGTLTPSSLHFERHHAGVPDLDPSTHTLTIHGLVDRPLVFSLDELKRLPSVTRIVFIECSGNTSSEWTGVSLSTLLHECAIQPRASWLLAEGRDAARVARSLPIEKAMNDAIVAYAQNGEPLRPEQGYPLRLIVPGFEGITHIKWIHRLEALEAPAMTRWEWNAASFAAPALRHAHTSTWSTRLCVTMRVMSRADRTRGSERRTCRRPGLAGDDASAEDGGKLLAVRHDIVGLHQPGDAVRASAFTECE